MIIKAKIRAGGGRSITRIPMFAGRMQDYLDADGKLSYRRAVAAFANSEYYNIYSGDDSFVLWVAMTFLENLHSAYEQLADDGSISRGTVCRQDKSIERRMDRGRNVYVRIAINRTANGASVNLRVDNPLGIVGESEPEAREYAIVCTQIMLRMAKIETHIKVTAEADIMGRAIELNRRTDLRRLADGCSHLSNGYCSPIKTDCPCYLNGKCGYAG